MTNVDWHAIPGRPGWYDPDKVAPSLRDLATTKSEKEAARLFSCLANWGILHNHSGTVYPAAVAAAPILLDILERGHRVARERAGELLSLSMFLSSCPGYDRVDTDYAQAVPICCAVAHHVRSRRGVYPEFAWLASEAREHWRLDVESVTADGVDTIAFGTLVGTVPEGVQSVESHTGSDLSVATARLEEGGLRLSGLATVQVGTVVFQAEGKH
jgi:hypothetical protein